MLKLKAIEHKGRVSWTALSQYPESIADSRVTHHMDVVDWMALACQCGLYRFGAHCLQKMLCNHHEVSLSSLQAQIHMSHLLQLIVSGL